MRVIKLALISFVFLFLVILAISLFFPSHARVSKALRMRAPREKVMEQLADPEKWKTWFPGADTATTLIISGKPQGMIINPKTNRYLAIEKITADSVAAEYKNISQKQVKTGWVVIPENDPGIVTVHWYMDIQLRWYPWEKFASIIFEKQYGPQMEKGLANLKKLVEVDD